MKLTQSLVAFCLSISFLSFSQQMPIDFSNDSDNFLTFGNSGFSFNTDPENSDNTVGQFFNDGSAENPWQGFYITVNSAIDLSVEQQLTLNFYQFDPNLHSITLKLENGSGPAVEVTLNTSGSGWANGLIFDFSNAKITETNDFINATGSYSQLSIFIDGGVSLAGTYLIDDINNGSEALDPNVIDIVYTDLVWEDNFDTTGTVNSDNWFRQTQLPSGGSWFNGEQQHYTNRNQNSFVFDGFLNIVAIKEPFTDQGETKQYTSARLNSKFAFTYGRVDVRAKLPAGNGTWPAIWTLGKNVSESGAYWQTQGFGTTSWPACGEIDIMEHGLHDTNEVSSAIHTPSSFGSTVNTETQFLTDVSNNFHVYSLNWSPNQITFLIDGVGYYTYNPSEKNDDTWPFDLDQYLILNVAMGGNGGAIDPTFTESRLVIDYVKVYQNIVLSVDEAFASKFAVYPNPASDLISIRTTETIDKLELFNSLGQLITVKQELTKRLDVEDLTSGFYFLKIYSGIRATTKKILIN